MKFHNLTIILERLQSLSSIFWLGKGHFCRPAHHQPSHPQTLPNHSTHSTEPFGTSLVAVFAYRLIRAFVFQWVLAMPADAPDNDSIGLYKKGNETSNGVHLPSSNPPNPTHISEGLIELAIGDLNACNPTCSVKTNSIPRKEQNRATPLTNCVDESILPACLKKISISNNTFAKANDWSTQDRPGHHNIQARFSNTNNCHSNDQPNKIIKGPSLLAMNLKEKRHHTIEEDLQINTAISSDIG